MAPATASDALIVVGFAPYSPVTTSLAHRARESETPIVLITDSALGPLIELAEGALRNRGE